MSEASRKVALITGVTGQDGSYLAEYLIENGYEVHGTLRRSSTANTARIDHLRSDHIFSKKAPKERGGLGLVYCDMTDQESVRRTISQIKPDEVYNLAAQSHVGISFAIPSYTADVVAQGALRLFDACKDYENETGKQVRIYQAGSSEMFGSSPGPQCEKTPFRPCSPYAVAKVAAHNYAINYRESYGMHISNGILFNHESPRRGINFVTRKITRSLTRIYVGLQDRLYLGNLDAYRDWGHAREYTKVMHLLLQQGSPDDFVVGTGKTIRVRDFLEYCLSKLGLQERNCVEISEEFFRPKEVDFLQADSNKLRVELGWTPMIDAHGLADEMLEHDLELAKRELLLSKNGYEDNRLGISDY